MSKAFSTANQVGTERGFKPLSPPKSMRLFVLALLMLGLASQSFAASPLNLTAGVGPILSSRNWSGYSAMGVISGPSLFPVTSSKTVLYIAFTEGTQADVGNMVLYQTGARGSEITAVLPVTLNGTSNPTINLTDPAVCPAQPVSITSPCIIRLDPLTLQLSSTSDYYFVTYFTADSNNSQLGLSQPVFATSSLTGGFIGLDATLSTVGQSVPVGNNGYPFGLLAVMTN